MPAADFVTLASSREWKLLWESDEIKAMIDAHVGMLLRANLDEKARARVAGRLSMLRELPVIVQGLADKQVKLEAKALAAKEERGPVSLRERLRQKIPQIL